jgi:putative ABC transport system permease protein
MWRPSLALSAQGVNAVSEETNWVTSVQGATADFFEVNNWHAVEGRDFTAQEVQSGAAVALLGKTTATNLFPRGDALGQRMRVNGIPIEIIGILEAKGQSGGGGMGRDRDDMILAPLSMVRNRITGGNRWVSRHVSSIQVLVQDGYDVIEAQDEACYRDARAAPYRAWGQQDNFMVVNFADMIKQRAAVAET